MIIGNGVSIPQDGIPQFKDDGHTQIWHQFFEYDERNVNLTLRFGKGTLSVDFGDGTTVTNTNDTDSTIVHNFSHGYSKVGAYIAKCNFERTDPTSRFEIVYGEASKPFVYGVHFGEDANPFPNNLYGHAEWSPYWRYYHFPAYVSSISLRYFQANSVIQGILIPKNILFIGDNNFVGCPNLKYIDMSDYDNNSGVPASNEIGSCFFNIDPDYIIYVKNQTMLTAFSSNADWSVHSSHMQIGGKYAEVSQ